MGKHPSLPPVVPDGARMLQQPFSGSVVLKRPTNNAVTASFHLRLPQTPLNQLKTSKNSPERGQLKRVRNRQVLPGQDVLDHEGNAVPGSRRIDPRVVDSPEASRKPSVLPFVLREPPIVEHGVILSESVLHEEVPAGTVKVSGGLDAHAVAVGCKRRIRNVKLGQIGTIALAKVEDGIF